MVVIYHHRNPHTLPRYGACPRGMGNDKAHSRSHPAEWRESMDNLSTLMESMTRSRAALGVGFCVFRNNAKLLFFNPLMQVAPLGYT